MTATATDAPAAVEPAAEPALKAPAAAAPAAAGAVDAKERESMRAFWAEHSSKPSVESMMLDSQAAEIDSEERPEVKREGMGARRSLFFGRPWVGWGNPGVEVADGHTR
jgi:hypothetical protein